MVFRSSSFKVVLVALIGISDEKIGNTEILTILCSTQINIDPIYKHTVPFSCLEVTSMKLTASPPLLTR